MNKPNSTVDMQCVNALRFLSIDAIQKANSGHPGMPMGAAPMAHVLWDRFLKMNPKNPDWFNRDRFILSAGHGSALQYSLLYLTGFDSVSIEDMKNFRQMGSVTPGHPENTVTKGIEVTTGPLGQGIANAVGMAMAQKHMAAKFNKPDFNVVDHTIYTIMGDGCHMEGISSEACSLAGHLGLGNLIALYDDNQISIDGPTDLTFTEDVDKRFESYGWHVQYIEDGNTDLEAIAVAIEKAKAETDRPSLIRVRTTIGFGSPAMAGSSNCHGAPLGDEEIAATRKNLGYEAGSFEVPKAVLDHMRRHVEDGAKLEDEWNKTFAMYKEKYPKEAAELDGFATGKLPDGWEDLLPKYSPDDPKTATRALHGTCLNALAQKVTGLIGGSADLAPSNKTWLKNSDYMRKGAFENRNLHFGVREHAMGAICNGMALHSPGLVPYGATFMVFSDYMRGAIRTAAISGAGTLFIMTHDSVAVGEDGPTHQPVEHVASLRVIPDLTVIRPADGNETSGAYKVALGNRNTPTLMALTRQKLPHLAGSSIDAVAKGAYVLSDADSSPDIILIGTGSEVSLCVEAAATLTAEGKNVRVVSMPSFELFEKQSAEYRESVLPAKVTKRLAVEAGTSYGWHKYVGTEGSVIGIERFGTSAPGGACLEKFGFTTANVLAHAKELLK